MAPSPLRLLLLSCFFAPFAATAQSGPSVLDAAGGSKTISSGDTYEYAIGQTITGAGYTSSSLVITPGVLQPTDKSTGVKSSGIAADELKVFPSPADHTLYLQPGFAGGGTLQYKLLDVAGNTVMQGEALLRNGTERQSLEVSPLAAGQYMLQVLWNKGGQQYAAGYKIQKLK